MAEVRTFSIRTLGCKANLSDSEELRERLLARGWRAVDSGPADLHVVNSCTVTDEADRQSRKLASRLARENPYGKVVMTGCAAQVEPEGVVRSPGVNYLVGNQDKAQLVDLVLAQAGDSAAVARGEILGGVRTLEELASRHPMDREWTLPSNALSPELTGSKTRVFYKIQEGCDAFCTYCIIPYGRGPSRSLPADRIVADLQALAGRGIREVVLTGTAIGAYEESGESQASGEALAGLVERILCETSIARLRVSSLDPAEMTPRLLALMESEPRFCPHFHVSLQSISSHILKLMKRKYRAEDVEERLCAVRALKTQQRPFVGMDIITGFPGETDAIFEESYARLEKLPWSRLHVFPYSERKGTPATRLPGAVQPRVRVERARKLMALSQARLEQLGRERIAQDPLLTQVLLERPRVVREGERSVRIFQGYTPDYWCVEIRDEGERAGEASSALARNTLVTARATGIRSLTASGDVVIQATLDTGL